MDWSKVRQFGALHFLTRASYVAIILVPIIAGMWPAVRTTVNAYNETLLQSALDTHEKVETLAARATKASKDLSPRLQRLLNDRTVQLEMKVRELGQALNEAAVKEKDLPYGFAAAFFAALAVILGHLLYELFADRLVKDTTRDDVARETLEQFDPESPDLKRRLGKALHNIGQIAALQPRNRHANLVRLPDQVVWIPSSVDYLVSGPDDENFSADNQIAEAGEPDGPAISEQLNDQPDDNAEHEAEGRKLEKQSTENRQVQSLDLQLLIIEQGAIAEYDAAATRNMGWAALAMFLYLTGMLLIATIFWRQSVNVAEEAGWIADNLDRPLIQQIITQINC